MIELTVVAVVATFAGFLVGSWHEAKHNKAVEDAKRYRQMVLRMIPKLRENFTAEYVYYALIQGQLDDHV